MRYLVGVMLTPNEVHPWHIGFVVKLVEMFYEESIILHI
jgi:hypothetical protein